MNTVTANSARQLPIRLSRSRLTRCFSLLGVLFALPTQLPAYAAPELIVEWEIDTHPSSATPLPPTLRNSGIGTMMPSDLTNNRIVKHPSFPDCNSYKDDTPSLNGDFYAIGWPALIQNQPVPFGCNMEFRAKPLPGFKWKPPRLTFALWIHSGNALGPTVLELLASADGFENFARLDRWTNFGEGLPGDQTQTTKVVNISDQDLADMNLGPGLFTDEITFRLVGAHTPGGRPGGWGGFSNTTKYEGDGSNLLLEGMVAIDAFSKAAVKCQRSIGQQSGTLLQAVHTQHKNCLNQEASGGECDTKKRDDRIAKRVSRVTKLSSACTFDTYVELGYDSSLTDAEIREGIIQSAIDAAVQLIRATYPAAYENKP